MIKGVLLRNALLVTACIGAGLLQWVFVKLTALQQSAEEFGRFASLYFLALILSMPLVTLQNGVARQVTALIAGGDGSGVGPYLRHLLRRWVAPAGGVCAVLLLLSGPISAWLSLGAPSSVVVLTGMLAAFIPLQLVLGTLAARDRLLLMALVILTDTALRCSIALAWPELLVTSTGALSVALFSICGALLLGSWWIRGDVFSRGGGRPARLEAVLARFVLGALLFYVAAFQDALLVRLVFTEAEAARYDTAATLGRIIHALPYPLIPVLVPVVTRAHAEGKSARPTLILQLVTVALAVVGLTVGGALRPDLAGSLVLDPSKHASLGVLVPLAMGTAGFFAMTSILLHYLLAQGRFGILFVTGAVVVAGALAALIPAADSREVMTRMVFVSGTFFVIAMVWGFSGLRKR